MHTPLISIVIPVYNVGKYLKQCLDSVLRQTYKNLEIICVNDGSTDNSLAILKEYEQKDHRIIVISQENKGQGFARNAGLKQVTSDYVSFVDSDDYIDPRYIEVLYERLYHENADFCVCGILPIGKDYRKNIEYVSAYQYTMKHRSTFPINPEYIHVAPWAKLFKIDIIRTYNLQFPIGLINEDNYLTFMYCVFSKRYTVASEKLYFHRLDNSNSTMMRTIYQDKHCYDLIKIYCQIFDSLRNVNNSEFYYKCLDTAFWGMLEYLLNLHKKSSIDSAFWHQIKGYLIRSKNARDKFKNTKFFNMLEDSVWR